LIINHLSPFLSLADAMLRRMHNQRK